MSKEAVNKDLQASLNKACYDGDVEQVKELLEMSEVSINGAGEFVLYKGNRSRWYSPLSVACGAGNGAMVDFLLSMGADPNGCPEELYRPLYHAVKGGNVACTRSIVSAGAKWAINSMYVRAMWENLATKDIGHIQAVVEAFPSAVNKPIVQTYSRTVMTPLHVVARHGTVDTVGVLLAVGAAVNAVDKRGKTPLHKACSAGNVATATALCEAGADVFAVSAAGRLPLHEAAKHPSRTRVLSSPKHRTRALVEVVLVHMQQQSQEEGSLSSALQITDNSGFTPLCYAFTNPWIAAKETVCTRMSSCGVTWNGVTTRGEHSLVVLAKAGKLDLVERLLAAVEDELGASSGDVVSEALWEAFTNQEEACVPPLAAVGWRLKPQSVVQLCCLYAYHGNLSLLQTVLGIDSSIATTPEENSGKTAVQFAREGGNDDVVECLNAEFGVDDVAQQASVGNTTTECGAPLPTGATSQLNSQAADTVQLDHLQMAVTDPFDSRLRTVYTTYTPTVQVDRQGTAATDLFDLGDDLVFAHILPCGMCGSGTYGSVMRGAYKGTDVVYKFEKREGAGQTVMDLNRMAHFANEARTLRVLQQPTHSNCVAFVGVAVDHEVGVAIVTEFCGEGTLAGLLSASSPFCAIERLALCAGLTAGLTYVHETGIVHGDIKPENVVLSGSIPKVIDFGGAYPYWRGRTAYTELYAAPEVLGGGLAVAQSDVYSLGCVIYETLTGQRVVDRSSNYTVAPINVGDGGIAQSVENELPETLQGLGLGDLLGDCWSPNISLRPRSVEGYESLCTMLSELDSDKAHAVMEVHNSAPATGNSPFMAAIQYGDVDEFDRLVAAGCDVNTSNTWGHTPLHVVAAVGQPAMLGRVLQLSPNHAADIFGVTPLAIVEDQVQQFGVEEAIHLVVQSYATSVGGSSADSVVSRKDEYPLHRAAASGDIGRVRVLLNEGYDPLSLNFRRKTAVELARESGGRDIVDLLAINCDWADFEQRVCDSTPSILVAKLLSFAEASYESRSYQMFEGVISRLPLSAWGGMLPTIRSAAEDGEIEFVRYLLEHMPSVENAANLNHLIGEGMVSASYRGHYEIVSLLLDKRSASVNTARGGTALRSACAEGHAKVVAVLLSAGADVDAADRRGNTALLRVSAGGHAAVVSLLLKAGADVCRCGMFGETALHIASEKGHCEVVSLLLDVVRNIDASSNYGRTALMLASKHGHEKVVKLLISAAANVNATTKNGKSALMLACSEGHGGVVACLLDAGAEINAVAADGTTALAVACAAGQDSSDDVAKLLLDAGASTDGTDLLPVPCLFLAALAGHANVVRRLLAAGVDMLQAARCDSPPGWRADSRFCAGQTPLDIAREKGHADVVVVLETHARSHPPPS